MKKLILLSLVIFVFISSCKKDEDNNSTPTPTSNNLSPLNAGASMSIKVVGQVMDESGVGISGSTVYSAFGQASTITDSYGYFILENCAAYQNHAFIKAEKSGYFDGSRSLNPVPGTNRVKIILKDRTSYTSFDASNGGVVTEGNVEIDFQSGSFLKNGVAFNGEVRVYANSMHPSEENMTSEMPGYLLGANDSEMFGLVSLGMFNVEIEDDQGNELELDPALPASITWDSGNMGGFSLPSESPMWWFDETAGFWREDGMASLNGTDYTAELSHFTVWNLDLPVDYYWLYFYFYQIYEGSEAQIEIRDPNNNVTASYVFDLSPELEIPVPSGYSIEISVIANCNGGTNEVYTNNLGPITSDEELDITLNPITTTISGTLVNCNNQPISNALALFSGGDYTFIEDGQFEMLICNTDETLTFLDYESGYLSEPIDLSSLTFPADLGQIEVCDEVISGETVFDIEGNEYATVTIGSQIWMAENLNTTTYSNGDPITVNLDDSGAWIAADPACTYDVSVNGEVYRSTYGVLYNYYSVIDERNICPSGWHVPSDDDWKTLESHLGMPSEDLDLLDFDRGTEENIGGQLKSTSELWETPNEGGNNASLFTVLPGGWTPEPGLSYNSAQSAMFWSTTNYSSQTAILRTIDYQLQGVTRGDEQKRIGAGVRCVQD